MSRILHENLSGWVPSIGLSSLKLGIGMPKAPSFASRIVAGLGKVIVKPKLEATSKPSLVSKILSAQRAAISKAVSPPVSTSPPSIVSKIKAASQPAAQMALQAGSPIYTESPEEGLPILPFVLVGGGLLTAYLMFKG